MRPLRATLALVMAISIVLAAGVGPAAATETQWRTTKAVAGGGTRTTFFDHDHPHDCYPSSEYDVKYVVNYSYSAGSSYITINSVRVTYYAHSGTLINLDLFLAGLDRSMSYRINAVVSPGETRSLYYPVDPNQRFKFATWAGSFSVIGQTVPSNLYDPGSGCLVEDYVNFVKP